MKRTAQSKTTQDLDSIKSSFLQVRILHCASTSHATADLITDKLRVHADATNLARILARMTRHGLVKVKVIPERKAQIARQYSLTLKGRHLLDKAKEHLRQFAEQGLHQ